MSKLGMQHTHGDELRRRFQSFQSDYRDNDQRETAHIVGYFLLVLTFLFFSIFVYAILASKFMPETGNVVLDWIRQDRYYSLLIPLSMPVFIIFIYVNWLSMKFFRHN